MRIKLKVASRGKTGTPGASPTTIRFRLPMPPQPDRQLTGRKRYRFRVTVQVATPNSGSPICAQSCRICNLIWRCAPRMQGPGLLILIRVSFRCSVHRLRKLSKPLYLGVFCRPTLQVDYEGVQVGVIGGEALAGLELTASLFLLYDLTHCWTVVRELL